jgi:hypothetical protein
MDKKVARTVVQTLNHPKIIDALNGYIDFRINKIREQLETVKEPSRVYELQGAIQELRKFKRIREDALAVDQMKEV